MVNFYEKGDPFYYQYLKDEFDSSNGESDCFIAAVVFVEVGKQYLPYMDLDQFLGQIEESNLPLVVETTPVPGFPYYEALIALIPAGTGVALAKLLRDLILEWVKTNRDREIEVRLKDGTTIRLRGKDATVQNVNKLLSSIKSEEIKRELF